MKQRITQVSPLYPKILFRFTDHPITVWAGVILLRVYFEWVGLRQEIGQLLGEFVKCWLGVQPAAREKPPLCVSGPKHEENGF
jgi:hypothetical protein